MQQPQHDLRPFEVSAASPRRFVAGIAVAALHVVVILALASGLAARLVDKIPQDIKADIVKEKPPDQPKTPPPPPPDLIKPPPQFIPPPDIVVSNEAPVNTITNVTNTVAPPPKPAISQPASIGRAHACGGKFYPGVAMRLNHEGTTTVTFKISADGTVSDVAVAKSSGYPDLDEAATPCVSTWKYKPAEQNGQPVETTWTANVKWQIPR
jgi:protein TonB